MKDNNYEINTTKEKDGTGGNISSEKDQEQNHLEQEQQQQQQQHGVNSINTTLLGGASMNTAMSHTSVTAIVAAPESTTTRPGAVHIPGWSRAARGDDYDESSSSSDESTESREPSPAASPSQLVATTTTSPHDDGILSAQLVDEEMRRQAYEQAAGTKRQQRRRRIISGCLLFIAVLVIVAVVVVVAALQQRDDDSPTRTMLSAPTTAPSTSFPPSTYPSSMPSAASSWRQIGNSMDGIQEYEYFGDELGFSADGNTIVATATTWTVDDGTTQEIAEVRAYTYHNETGEWKQLGQLNLTCSSDDCEALQNNIVIDLPYLSPNGKFLGISANPASTQNDKFLGIIPNPTTRTSRSRIFSLTNGGSGKTNATTTTHDDDTGSFWEQIGTDIVLSSPNDDDSISCACLTDSLILAIGTSTGQIYIYQFDANISDWVRMGEEFQLFQATFSMQLAVNKRIGKLILAVGGIRTARTFRYEPDSDSWIQFGSELTANEETKANEELSMYSIVFLSLAMDGETIAVGLQDDYTLEESIGLLRTFSYDAGTDDWVQLGNDVKDSSFLFGTSFSLSANGKVLAATTELVDIYLGHKGRVTGQVRTWDFIADNDNEINGSSGEWIQRGAALEVGALGSLFGWRMALSADGNRLATSAIVALNEQGVKSGKLRVFEQY